MEEISDNCVPFGLQNKEKIIIEEFVSSNVKQAGTSQKVCKYLINKANKESRNGKCLKYLTIGIPADKEDFAEMMKTVISLMENIEFMKKKVNPLLFPVSFVL